MGAAIFIGAVVALVIAFFAAKEFEKIAAMKGHTEKKYFWWCFLLGFVGWPMVIALPGSWRRCDGKACYGRRNTGYLRCCYE